VAVGAEEGMVLAAIAALFWAAALGIALDSVREAVVEQAARNRTVSTRAGWINRLRPIPGRANQ
jgi:hypothetical protein